MTNEALQGLISTWAEGLEFSEEASQFLDVTVPRQALHAFAKQLKTNPDTSFDLLFCLSGVDWKDHLMVIYHLESTEHRHQLVVRVKTDDRENVELDSVSDIWQTAVFHELEAYDFFGFQFQRHPKLKRLFLNEDWVGWPLRKDYVDDVNIIDL